MKARYLLIALALVACRRAPRDAAPARAEPLNVAALVAGCEGESDCAARCQEGNGGACVELGRLYEFGHVGPRDPARAYPYYERACTLGSASGCYNQALLLETGKGITADRKRAVELYRRVCEMGAKTGCVRAEELTATP